jgi:outer membrane protein OmpA-like peptidoglycan-associated protein
MKIRHTAVLLSVAVAFTSACATDDPNRRAKTGAAIGAVAGAVVGHQAHDENGRFVGAAVGALTGAVVGNYMDKQQRDLENALALELGANAITVTRVDEETLKLDLSSEATFDINSADVKSNFRRSLRKLASVVDQYDKTAVHLLGHTDSTGTESYNQKLSETRADAVSRALAASGVDRSRLRTVGYGESQPVSSNDTKAGRSQNRRVEVYLRSIVEGRENEAFRTPS